MWGGIGLEIKNIESVEIIRELIEFVDKKFENITNKDYKFKVQSSYKC